MRLLFLILLIYTCISITSVRECEKNTITKTKITLNKNNQILISVSSKDFKATIYDNPTAKAFLEILPLSLIMKDLNDNEKYFNLSVDLPTEKVNVNSIQSGDLMLWQSNTIVLFYKDIETSYRYTKIGKIDNPKGLMTDLDNGDIKVTFKIIE